MSYKYLVFIAFTLDPYFLHWLNNTLSWNCYVNDLGVILNAYGSILARYRAERRVLLN